VNSPVDPPADQVADGASGVAVKSPSGPDEPAAKATRVPELATGTSADTVPATGWFVDGSGVARHCGRSGVCAAHSGSWYKRSRDAQSPPYACRNRL
jgi:hypothetical protein